MAALIAFSPSAPLSCRGVSLGKPTTSLGVGLVWPRIRSLLSMARPADHSLGVFDLSRYFEKGCTILACMLALVPTVAPAEPSGTSKPMFEDRETASGSVPVARNVRAADYVDVYSVSLDGVTAGQLV